MQIRDFNPRKDMGEVIRIEYSRFAEPMGSMLIRFLIDKYGSKYWKVLVNGDDQILAHLASGVDRPDCLHIFSVAVKEECEGRGYARALMQEIISLAGMDDDIQCIALEVKEQNNRAISLYEKLGFEQIGIDEGYYEDGSTAILMHLNVKKQS